jgi:DNA polymerase elongation subunit (family B)
MPEPIIPLAWDLETIPNPEAVALLPIPEPDPRLKDPAKIELDIIRKRATQEGKMALNGNTAMIVALGWWTGEPASRPRSTVLGCEVEDEASFLADIWDILAESKHYVTFNGMAFDVPMLLRRSLILGVTPPVRISTRRYDIPPAGNHYDLQQIFSHHGDHPTGGMDQMGRAVLGEGKIEGVSGADVARLYAEKEYEKIGEYARKDVEITLGLWRRAKGIYF